MVVWPKALTARLSLFHQSILAMRGAGYAWTQIRDALVKSGCCDAETTASQVGWAWHKTQKGVESGRLISGNHQLDMPKIQPQKTGATESRGSPQATNGVNRPLPSNPAKRIPDNPDDVQAELAKHGLVFK